MKARKDHDSDEEHEDEAPDITVVESSAVHPMPVSPPSQTAVRRGVSDEQLQQLRYTYMDDAEGGVMFEEQSMQIKWPYCGLNALSLVEYQNNILGYLVALILLFALGWMSFFLLPLVLSLTKSAVHRCAKCLNEVKDNSLLGLNWLEDKVISFEIGTFGVAISRRYLLYILMWIGCVIIIHFLLMFGINVTDEVPLTNIQWTDFRDDWGFFAFTKNSREAQRAFDRTYSGKGITWDGYIVQVNSLSEDSMAHFHHASSILVKMVPDDKSEDDASLALTLSEPITEKFKEVLLQLDVGDHIRFNATITALGDRTHLHHFHLFGLEKVDGSAHVNLHVHYKGRYKFHQPNESPIIENRFTVETDNDNNSDINIDTETDINSENEDAT